MNTTVILATTYVLALKDVKNLELAAMNNAIQGFGNLNPSNLAFETAVKLQLVKPNGVPFDLGALRRACAHEVKRRVSAGTFFVEGNGSSHETE